MGNAVRLPAPILRPFISHYAGFRADDVPPGTHAGVPSRHAHLIISLGAPIDVVGMPNAVQRPGRFPALVAGLHDAPATVRRASSMEGLHVFLEPIGVRAVLGVSATELASRVFDLSDLWGQRSVALLERLKDASTWEARFAVLDDVFTRTLRTIAHPRALAWAWGRLVADGTASIDALARRTEWSRQYFTASFRTEFGVTPVTARRIFRFERACRLIKDVRPRLADVAVACGYHDQAHMTRDWNALAGCSPKVWIASELPFLQDYELAGGDDDSVRGCR